MSTYRLIQSAILVMLGVAFATSFQSGADGAGRLGYPPIFEAALPLVCDVVAGVATAIHGRVRQDPAMRRLVTWYVLVPMALSWGANSVDHAYRASTASTHWSAAGQISWFSGVVLAAGICPVAVAALLFLNTRFLEFEQRQAPVTDEVAEARTKFQFASASNASPDVVAQARREYDAARKRQHRAKPKEVQVQI